MRHSHGGHAPSTLLDEQLLQRWVAQWSAEEAGPRHQQRGGEPVRFGLGGLALAGLVAAVQDDVPEFVRQVEASAFGGLRGGAPADAVAKQSGLAVAAWHDAAHAALSELGARRIGLLTPFDAIGNGNARQMFEDLGYEVVSSFGFACAQAKLVAHVPDWAKEKAITQYLATPANRLDAVVQCGTNMSMIQVAQRLEPTLGIPVVGINAALLWYALRQTGLATPLRGGGRLLASG